MISRFLEYLAVERHYSQRTIDAYRDDLRTFCAFLGWEPEDFDPSKVDETDVKLWVVELLENEKKSPRSIRQYLSALHSFYKFMLRTGVVKRDITLKVIAPKVDKPLPVFFKENEMERATAYEAEADDFESIRDCLIIEMLYQTGARQAEILGLTDSDVDTIQGQVRIFGKRKKERIVPIGESLVKQIKDYLEARQRLGSASTFFVRLKKNGEVEPLTKSTLYNIVRARMGEVSTLKKHSPHVLRHTFATAMLNHHADLESVKELLGHARLSTTEIYTHTTFEELRKVYNDAHPRG